MITQNAPTSPRGISKDYGEFPVGVPMQAIINHHGRQIRDHIFLSILLWAVAYYWPGPAPWGDRFFPIFFRLLLRSTFDPLSRSFLEVLVSFEVLRNGAAAVVFKPQSMLYLFESGSSHQYVTARHYHRYPSRPPQEHLMGRS